MTIFGLTSAKTIMNKPEPSDYQDLLQAVDTEIRNHKANIKDSRRAKRNSAGSERRMYRNVIKYNKRLLREARVKRRFIESQSKSTWWIWLIAGACCVLIMAVFPSASLAVVLLPLWGLALIGVIYILFMVKR